MFLCLMFTLFLLFNVALRARCVPSCCAQGVPLVLTGHPQQLSRFSAVQVPLSVCPNFRELLFTVSALDAAYSLTLKLIQLNDTASVVLRTPLRNSDICSIFNRYVSSDETSALFCVLCAWCAFGHEHAT